MAAPIWILLLSLMLLGGFALLLGLGVYALASNRPGVGAVAALGLLMLLVLAGIAALIGVRSMPHINHEGWIVGPVSVEHHFEEPARAFSASQRVSWSGLLVLIAVPVLIVAGMVRGLKSRKSSGPVNGLRWLPVALALVLLSFIGLAGLKWTSARHYWWQETHARHQIEQVRRDIERQQAEMRRKAYEMRAHVQAELNHSKLEEDIDRFDAPRIPLKMPEAPMAVMAVSTTASNESAAVMLAKQERTPEEAKLVAEAEAGVAVITGEAADEAKSDAEFSDAKESDKALTAASTASTGSPVEQPGPVEQPAEDGKARAEESPTDESQQRPAAIAQPLVEAEPLRITTEPRPAWVEKWPKRVGNTVRELVITEEYATAEECRRAADILRLLKTYQRLRELTGKVVFDTSLPSISFLGNEVAADGVVVLRTDPAGNAYWNDPRLQYLDELGISADFIRREIVSEDGEYFEVAERSVGPMAKLYTLMEFTPAVDKQLVARWEAHERKSRLATIGVGAGGMLGLLGMVYGLLKVDTWTKGYYTKRLFLGVPAAIIGLGALAALLAS